MSNQSSQNPAFFIKEVKIVRAHTDGAFVDRLNQAMGDGWVLHGNMMIHPNGELVQPVVKYDERIVDLANMTMDMVAEQINQFKTFR